MADLKRVPIYHPAQAKPEIRDFSKQIGETLYYHGMTSLALEVGERLIKGDVWTMTPAEKSLILEALRTTPLYITREIVKALEADSENDEQN